MNIVEVYNVGKVGVVKDVAAHLLPPEAWTDTLNVRFKESGAKLSPGESTVFGTPTVAPIFLMPVPSTSTTTYWIYTSKTKAYVYEGGVHSNITRQTAGVDVNYTTVNNEDWTGTLLGGIPVLNNAADVPQYWSSYSSAVKLAALPNWTSTLRAKVVRAFGRYLVALNLTDGSTRYPHTIQWSHAADPGSVPTSWDYTDATVDAGRLELTDAIGGEIKDGLMLGNVMVIYKAASTHLLRYVGGNDIFASDLMLANSGILAPRCACTIMDGRAHFVVTESDIIIHYGNKDATSICNDQVRDYIFDNIELDAVGKSFTFNNPRQDEAWFVYPTADNTEVNMAAVYNYKKKTWTFRQFEAIYADFGLIPSTVADTWASASGTWDSDTELWSRPGERGILLANRSRTLLQRLDSGYQYGLTAISASLERADLAYVGKDRMGQPKVDMRVVKQISRLTLKGRGQDVTLQVRIGSRNNLNEEITWSTPYDYILETDPYLDFDPPVVGKLLSLRFTYTGEDNWTIEGYDLEGELLGNL